VTPYPFDTSIIEYVRYRRDLRYSETMTFKEKLAAKVKATYEAGKDPNYSTFLKHFGKFTVPTLETKEVSKEDFIIERLNDLQSAIERVARSSVVPFRSRRSGFERLEDRDVLAADNMLRALTPTNAELAAATDIARQQMAAEGKIIPPGSYGTYSMEIIKRVQKILEPKYGHVNLGASIDSGTNRIDVDQSGLAYSVSSNAADAASSSISDSSSDR
jgi:hypothetical protein